jgi:hypothetical protein
MPTVSSSTSTVVLIALTTCPACREEVESYYPELLSNARDLGFRTRMIVVPREPEADRWFLERVPTSTKLIFDTLGLATDHLRVEVAPSVVVVTADGTVQAVFSPSRSWPVTKGDLKPWAPLAHNSTPRGG